MREVQLSLVLVLGAVMGCGTVPELLFPDDDAGPARAPFVDAGQTSRPDLGLVGPAKGLETADAAASPAPPGSDSVDAAATFTAPDAAVPDATPAPPVPSVDASAPHVSDAAAVCVPPAGAQLCCGNVPCVGKKCAAHCAECASCAGRVCCVAPNGKSITCGANVAACGHGHGGGQGGEDDQGQDDQGEDGD